MVVYNSSDSEKLTDEEIIRLVQNGDSDKFGFLIDRYQAKMLRYAKKFLFNAENSQDLVQEIFIKAYKNIESFDINLKFSPWLYRIAHNLFINEIKKKDVKTLLNFNLDIFFPKMFSGNFADKDAIDNELKGALEKCIDKLEVKYREVVVLYYFEDLSYKEISNVLHIPVSAVGIRLNRAKALMKKIIKI